jgi:DNA polymerase III sliding clamp (beta) subunit (PCNA family)
MATKKSAGEKGIRAAVDKFVGSIPEGTTVTFGSGDRRTTVAGKKKAPRYKSGDDVAEANQFQIGAERLLNALKASFPLTSKSVEEAHLTQVRFEVGPERVKLSATDGHAACNVFAPLEDQDPARDFSFCLQRSYAPLLIKMLSRINAEQRAQTVVEFTVTRFKIHVQAGDAQQTLPNSAEQLTFPAFESAIPERVSEALTSVTTFGVGPVLLARVMRAAAHVASDLIWRAPATPISPIRFDAVDSVGELSAIYIVMPMKSAAHVQGDDGTEEENSVQENLSGEGFGAREA